MLLQLPLLSIGLLAANALSSPSTPPKVTSKAKTVKAAVVSKVKAALPVTHAKVVAAAHKAVIKPAGKLTTSSTSKKPVKPLAKPVVAKTSPSPPPKSKVKKPVHLHSSLQGSIGHRSSYIHPVHGTLLNDAYFTHVSDLADKYASDGKDPTQINKLKRSVVSKNVAAVSPSHSIQSNATVKVGHSNIGYDFDLYGTMSVFPSSKLKGCKGQGYEPSYDSHGGELRKLLGFSYPVGVFATQDRRTSTLVQGDILLEDFTFLTVLGEQLTVSGSFLLVQQAATEIYCARGTIAITRSSLYARAANYPRIKNKLLTVSSALLTQAAANVITLFYSVGKGIDATNAFAQLSVGVVDPKNMKDVNSLVYYDVAPGGSDTNKNHWVIQGTKVVLDNGKLSTTALGLLVIDSLTPFILLPPALVQEIYASIGGGKVPGIAGPGAASLYEFPCEKDGGLSDLASGVSLAFTFDGNSTQWQIASSDFNMAKSSSNPGQCVGSIQAASSKIFSTLGTSFLSSFVTVYEYQGFGPEQIGVRIGLATSINNKGTSV